MPDATDSNIFAGAPALFLDAVKAFAAVPSLSLPLRRESAGGAALHSIAPYPDGGAERLPAFTSPSLLSPPLATVPSAEAALALFHAPNHDLFIFNPRHPQAAGSPAPLRATRRDVSLLAGFLAAGEKAAGDPASAAAAERAAGRLHAAHYLYAAAAARNPASRARFALNFVLVELGLLQEAYDAVKDDGDPEASLALAMIYRKTGDTQSAAKLLASLPQGSALEELRETELAWVALESGRGAEAEKVFRRISASAFEKAEALSGLGAALAKSAFETKDKAKFAEAAGTLRSALFSPSQASSRIAFQLGNLYFRAGDFAQAEACYRSSAAAAPAVQTLGNLGLTLLRNGRLQEAAAVTLRIALTDPASAARLAAQFPKGSVAGLFPEPAPQPAPAPAARPAPLPAEQPAPEPSSTPPAAAGPAAVPPDAPAIPAAFRKPAAAPAQAAPLQEASLAPSQPQQPAPSGRTAAPAPQPAPAAAGPAPAPAVKIETFSDIMAAPGAPTEAESRKDDFISRAFQLASDLEDETGRKVYFNADGLAEAEKKLRLTFLKAAAQQRKIDMVKDSAAFLCYFLQERHKGRLMKLPDFDPWGWPMVFELPNFRLTTYPVQRVWRLLWEENVPEPGWLSKYAAWVADRLRAPAPLKSGVTAVKGGLLSHPERLADTATEHRRMLVLASSLSETAGIETGRSGLYKINDALRANFRPDIPPTADGWKLLRCYGHLLAATLIKDFKASWYNTDGEDGGWSLQTPWKTCVFPLGKVYKTAANGGDLVEYYDALLAEKTRVQGGPM